jgi:glycine/D-amino acid oxidase-like deaminating enzyme
MPERETDVLIVGGGVVGAAIFHTLASAGRPVTLIEGHRIASGATGSSGGVVRCFHDDRTDSQVLADRALFGWRYYRDFQQQTGTRVVLRETGFLYLLPVDRRDWAQREVRRLAEQVPISWLDDSQVARQFGQLLDPQDAGAVWEPRAGYLEPLAVVHGFVRAGKDNGGRVLIGTEVRGPLYVDRRLGGVQTSAGPVPGSVVVLAAGARTPRLCTAFGVSRPDLYVKAVQVDLWRPSTVIDDHPSYADDVHDLNGRPDNESGGIYLGVPTDPGTGFGGGESRLDPEHTRRAGERGRKRLRWLADAVPEGGVRGVECFTQRRPGLVGRTDEEPRLLLATGFNGSGFRMAPWAAVEVFRLLDGAPRQDRETTGQ